MSEAEGEEEDGKKKKKKKKARMGIFWSTSTIMREDRGIGYFLRWLNQNEVGVEVDIYVFFTGIRVLF